MENQLRIDQLKERKFNFTHPSLIIFYISKNPTTYIFAEQSMLSKERSPKSLGSCAANSRLVGAQQRVSSGGAPGGPAPTTESTPADAASDPRM